MNARLLCLISFITGAIISVMVTFNTELGTLTTNEVSITINQIVGIITVRSALSEITEEVIESLPVRLALVSRTAESPFADTGGNIASGLEDFRYSDLFAGKRPVVRVPVVCRLALIASDEAVPGVFPCHKDAS